ncbi:putative Porin domain-containing protein [Medicago truncatula]|uniref:Porin/voltage-dependent anion-selective channel protein n=1 Tax=Medicago truncatula TaxID=3880 RepID=A0A072VEI7_MEDTR|nr:mitochondrial outer membrane protein porin 2 [Medicago truncatula]KEH40016.1 porin/voltage-dependent anion-selective channel protein [Medicago truncatula]RHN77235.1 putative Porin domain-containing protein [Medicago truncatula]
MSSKGPGLFSDIGKKSRDILTKDYNSDQKLTISSSTNSGLDLNSTLLKSRGLSSGDVAAQFKHNNKTLHFKVDTDSTVLTTFSATDFVPSAKVLASVRLPDYKSGKIEVQYLHDHAGFTAAVDLNRKPAIDFSATIGTPGIAFGAETSYSTLVGNFTKYNAGLCLKLPSSSASVLLADKGDSMKVSYLRDLEKLNGGAIVGEISRRFSTNENTLTVGCSYVVDPQTTVKAKLNNHGNLEAVLQHDLTHKSFLTISGAFETKALENSPKFGFSLLLKP